MNRKIISAAVAVITALSCASCGKPMMPDQESAGTNVKVYTAGADSIQNNVKYIGEIKSSQETVISPKISAKIVSINVEEGDYVNAGQVLAELDRTDLQNTYDSALASYKSALASYNSVANATTKQSSTTAQNSLTNAQLNYNDALTAYNREVRLYNNGETSSVVNARVSYNDALTAYNRELELYNNGQSASVVNATQSYNNALDAYNREKELYDNDTALVAAGNSLQTAQENEQRMTELYNIGAVSQADYDAAVRNTANAQSNYDTLNSQKQSSLNNSYAQLVSAQEALNTAKVNASASLESARSRVVTCEDALNTAKVNASTALDNAKSKLESSEKALAQAKENIGVTDTSNSANIASAQAALEGAKTALNTASNNLANTKITALESGYVSSKNAELGAMATAGAALFTIKNPNALVAEISVTESVIPYIQTGTKAKLTVTSAGIEDADGVVTLVNPTKDAQTGMYTVQVSADNSSGALNVGMFADVNLTLQDIANTITVPSEALIQEKDKMYVYVVNPDGKTAEKREIVVGLETDDKAEVASGVSAGERVVVSGADYLSETNNAINIVE